MSFSKKVDKVLSRLSKISPFTARIYLISNMLRPNGFLYETGWKMSISKKMPVNKNGIEIIANDFSDLIEIKGENIIHKTRHIN